MTELVAFSIALELHVHVSILSVPLSVQVLAFLWYIPRGGTAGHRHYLIGVAKLSSAEVVPVYYLGLSWREWPSFWT